MKHTFFIIFHLFFLISNAQDNWIIDSNGCKVHNPYPVKKESIVWTGNCINGIANGYGKLIWYKNGKNTGDIYIGTLFNGKPEGDGTYNYSYDLKVIGKFKNGEIYSGTAILYLNKKDSAVYEGEFNDGIFNGIGILYYTDGRFIEGEFKDGYPVDAIYHLPQDSCQIESNNFKYYLPKSGKITWSDGTVYIGEIKNYNPHGYGTATFPDGEKVTGKWRRGYPQ